MTDVAIVLIALAGILHLGVFAAASLAWRPLRTWRLVGIRDEAAAETARPWASTLGWVAMVLAIGAIGGAIGVWMLSGSLDCAQWTPECAAEQVRVELAPMPALAVMVFSAAGMVVTAIALAVAGGRAVMRAAAVQGILPALGLILLAIGALTR